MKVFLFFLISTSAWAQIERPWLGVMLDENGCALAGDWHAGRYGAR